MGTLQAQVATYAENDEQVQQQQKILKRRVRAVVVCVDRSGSVAGDLEEGVKRFYKHLSHLNNSSCQTYVMTIEHGIGAGWFSGQVNVMTRFNDPWTVHEAALDSTRIQGTESHWNCLTRVKEEISKDEMMVRDIQVVLLGDREAQGDMASPEALALCQDFVHMVPAVPIHSVVVATHNDVKCGTGWWHTWDYSARTNGRDMHWNVEDPLPELGNFLL